MNLLPARQQGAALVVGLLLLLVLTLLAISGMNTASLELVMAGNTQYQQVAFQNAEHAIARSLIVGTFNPSDAPQTDTTSAVSTSTIAAQNNGDAMPGFWGSSWDDFSTFHFEMTVKGLSNRNAKFEIDQGIAVIGPASSTWGPTTGLPASLTP
jgi:type IV pilus assembly protein PilX